MDDGLQVKLFNYVDVLYRGKSIFKEKQLTAKLKQLLQYFLMNHSDICSPDSIIKDLWPDNEYTERKKVLQTYVHRLRNALSKDNTIGRDFSDKISIIYSKGNYVVNVAPDVTFDTNTFKSLVSESYSLKTSQDLKDMTQKLAAVYDGHFLADCPNEKMVLRVRNSYLQMYCGAMGHILEKLSDLGEYADILSICETFFKIEEFDNGINLIYLNTLIKEQQTNFAVRHYNYLKEKMKDTYGMSVPEELTAVIHSVKDTPKPREKEDDLSETKIKALINDIVQESIKNSKTKYAFAQIMIKSAKPLDDKRLLEISLQGSLRKNDMYALIDQNTAVALLYEAKEKNYDLIATRIKNHIEKNYSHLGVVAEILFRPVVHVD